MLECTGILTRTVQRDHRRRRLARGSSSSSLLPSACALLELRMSRREPRPLSKEPELVSPEPVSLLELDEPCRLCSLSCRYLATSE